MSQEDKPPQPKGTIELKDRTSVAARTRWLGASGATVGEAKDGWLPADFDDSEWVQNVLTVFGCETRRENDEITEKIFLRAPESRKERDRLVGAIESALAPEVVFLDIDGVLIDVGDAYVHAIRHAAKALGVEVTRKALLKEAPILGVPQLRIRALLQKADIRANMKEIKQAFDKAYAGTSSKAGTRQMEKLIPSREWLDQIVEWIPLGAISTRKRADLDRVVQRFDLSFYLDTVIAGGTGSPPPEADLAKAGMKSMGVRRAWWIASQPDHIRAARRGNMVPIGIVAPGDDPEKARLALEKAGAARVLDQLEGLNDLLP